MSGLEGTSIEAATKRSGDLNVPPTTVQAYLVVDQTLTSHGNEAVSDGTIITNVAHSPGEAILTANHWNVNDSDSWKGRVHVPIHNPPNVTQRWYLRDISVNLEGVNNGSVEFVTVYYDQIPIKTEEPNAKRAFNYWYDDHELEAYPPPKGIAVDLVLRFPERNSSVKLYSIALLYEGK